MLYGGDLLRAGWNTSGAPPTDFAHVHARGAAFERALAALAERVVPRCCGC
jgi:hypothetical protein